ncbi:helix-turn-helix domain-containing protein [Salinimicrobium oceani]|uniref:Helix-turn-helix domain-containing protein n=1 Tax=Salinimicrobium oceani TaxID=2722702 RepID=A0ABX1D144_9FLAO|nr:helix-turn-helix domain-containing protein [Salinimicrobium oceani]NJW54060.1 helix-turn-helix domain-containing protein [Salinimicrobium oceani]
MSRLKSIREQQHLTQQELSERSGVSVRTIQRIESGTDPKGQTLKMLISSLQVKEEALVERPSEGTKPVNQTLVKLINFSSLPVTIFPPANILLPLVIMFFAKKFNPLTRQIVSLQIFWSICAFIIFMLFNFMKNSFGWSNDLTLVMMIVLVLSNVIIILVNAAEIDKNQRLRIKLNFSII